MANIYILRTMAFSDYHFITQWNIKGSPARIYEILKEGQNYDRWWKPAYVKTEKVDDKKIQATVRAKLPYTLTFTTELIREIPNQEIEIKSAGELEGNGLWKLEASGDYNSVTFFWDVKATKPLIRWLSFFLKPLFKWNHDWVMKTGENCLQKEIDRIP